MGLYSLEAGPWELISTSHRLQHPGTLDFVALYLKECRILRVCVECSREPVRHLVSSRTAGCVTRPAKLRRATWPLVRSGRVQAS